MRLGPALGVPRPAFRQVEPPVDQRQLCVPETLSGFIE